MSPGHPWYEISKMNPEHPSYEIRQMGLPRQASCFLINWSEEEKMSILIPAIWGFKYLLHRVKRSPTGLGPQQSSSLSTIQRPLAERGMLRGVTGVMSKMPETEILLQSPEEEVIRTGDRQGDVSISAPFLHFVTCVFSRKSTKDILVWSAEPKKRRNLDWKPTFGGSTRWTGVFLRILGVVWGVCKEWECHKFICPIKLFFSWRYFHKLLSWKMELHWTHFRLMMFSSFLHTLHLHKLQQVWQLEDRWCFDKLCISINWFTLQ